MEQSALIVAHGSPSNPEQGEVDMQELAARVAVLLPGWRVRGVTLAAPGRLEAAVVELGGPVVYPFFMAGGWFTKVELPRRLAAAGYVHYEISNFAKPGRECWQNLLYWNGGEYIGIGPAAHSHWRGKRWGNSAELPGWKREFEERLEPEAQARETLVMGLRRIAGWGRAEFREATGYSWTRGSCRLGNGGEMEL